MANIYVEGQGPQGPQLKQSLLPADIAANGYTRGKCVVYGSDNLHAALVAAAGVLALGILEEDAVSTKNPTSVIEFGQAIAQIGANVTAQQQLTTDANGRLVPAQPGQPVVAIALEAQTYVAANSAGVTSCALVQFLGQAGGVMPGDQVTYAAASGAIAIAKGTVALNGAGALAMTLAAPSAAQDGTVIYIVASTAHAHTVTTPANAINGADDTVTYAAVGDGIEIEAVNGKWLVRSLRGATLSEV